MQIIVISVGKIVADMIGLADSQSMHHHTSAPAGAGAAA